MNDMGGGKKNEVAAKPLSSRHPVCQNVLMHSRSWPAAILCTFEGEDGRSMLAAN